MSGVNAEQPVVSVLMTAYNREKYISIAIDSVLASSFTNFELIIVDDGSSDNTVKIARQYAASDERVKVFINEKNLGDYPNRNQAASYAKGRYLKYIDSDDYIYPLGLEQLVNTMEKFPGSGWGLCSMKPDSARPFPFQLNPAEAYRYHYNGNGLFDRSPLSAIIVKKNFDEVGGFANIRMAGDFEMWHRLAQRFPVTLMQQGIVWYRQHDQQEMNEYSIFKTKYEELSGQYLSSADCPLTVEESKEILRRLKKQKKFSTVKKILKSSFSKKSK